MNMKYIIVILFIFCNYKLIAQRPIQKIETFLYQSKNGKGILISITYFNASGNPLLKIMYNRDTVKNITIYETNHENKIICVTQYNGDGVIIDKIEKNYKNGKEVSIVFNDDPYLECQNDDANYKVNCKYDDRGNLKVIEKIGRNKTFYQKYVYKRTY